MLLTSYNHDLVFDTHLLCPLQSWWSHPVSQLWQELQPNDPRCESLNISCSRVPGSCSESYCSARSLGCLRQHNGAMSKAHTRALPCSACCFGSLWPSAHTDYSPHHGLWYSLSQTVYLKCRDTLISASSVPSEYPSSCSPSPWLLLQFCHLRFNIGSLWGLKCELESATFPF